MCAISPLSPQWLCGNSCTWTRNVRLYLGGTSEPRVLNKQSKERNISDRKQDGRNIGPHHIMGVGFGHIYCRELLKVH